MFTKSTLLLLPLVLAVGCQSAAKPPSGPTGLEHNAPSDTSMYNYTATVDTQASDTVSGLEARFGGKVLMFKPEQKFAVLGYLTESAVPTALVSGGTVEANKGAFQGNGQLAWIGGKVTAWAGGKVTAWAGGKVTAWAGGEYTIIPENTLTWKQIHLEAAQALAPRLGEGVKVAVIDTGIDLNHPAFTGGIDTANMWDFVGNDAVPQDEGVFGETATGHGTNVAGIVLQIAPRAQVLPLRVLATDGSGDVSAVAQAIDYAVQRGAQIINLSLGSEKSSPAVRGAIEAAAARGVAVIASSGNTGDKKVTFPASDAYVYNKASGLYSMSVGSVDSLDHKSDFSTYGDKNKPLEMMAPGEAVYAPAPGNRLAAWSGTSMSAPMVSGALALALGQQPANTAALIGLAQFYSDDIYRDNLNDAYKGGLGKGRLNIENFLLHALKR